MSNFVVQTEPMCKIRWVFRSSSEAVVTRLTDPNIMFRESMKPSQNKRFVCKHHAVSLFPSLSTFTTCYRNLQRVRIQKFVRHFAEPDQGQTSIPRVNLVSACLTLHPMRTTGWVYSYISKKRKISDKYHKSSSSLRCMQLAVTSKCEPA